MERDLDLRFARSASRHGISRERAEYVIAPRLRAGDALARTVTTKHGRVLTEADIERVADEFEAGFDLSTWVPRPGRPPLDLRSTAHSPRIAVRVPETLHRRVMARAAAEGRSVSQVVRKLLDEYVGRS